MFTDPNLGCIYDYNIADDRTVDRIHEQTVSIGETLIIRAKRFPHPNVCHWLVAGPSGHGLTLHFDDIVVCLVKPLNNYMSTQTFVSAG